MSRLTGSAVVAAVVFGAVLSWASPAGGVAGFGDVRDNAFYAGAVQWMVDNDITTGTSPTCFSPDDGATRGQAAAFMWRMEGEPAAPAHSFSDVTAGWQQGAVSWMAHTGVTTGTTPTTYSPDRTVTRGELAVLLHRLAGSPTGFPAHPFFDVTAQWQQDAVSWMSHNAITTGTTSTTFSPELVATRGELATFFHRYKGSPGVTTDPASPQCGGTVSFVEAGDLVGSLSLSITEYAPGVEFTVTLTVTNVSDHPVALERRSGAPRYLAVHGFPTDGPSSGGGFGAYLWLGDVVLDPGQRHTMSRSWDYGDPDAVEVTYEVVLAAGDSFNRLVNTVALVAGVPPVRIPVGPG